MDHHEIYDLWGSLMLGKSDSREIQEDAQEKYLLSLHSKVSPSICRLFESDSPFPPFLRLAIPLPSPPTYPCVQGLRAPLALASKFDIVLEIGNLYGLEPDNFEVSFFLLIILFLLLPLSTPPLYSFFFF